jgi:rare lipoprotein A
MHIGKKSRKNSFSASSLRGYLSCSALCLALSCGVGSAISFSQPAVSAIAYDKTYNIPLDGKASWIGERFQGKKTASGELFDMNDLTASHATLPFGTKVKVISNKTKKSVVVRINNRSEVDTGRVIDLSKRAAEQIGLVEEGVGLVTLAVVSPNAPVSDAPQAANTTTLKNVNNTTVTQTEVATSDKYQIQYGSFFDLENAIEFRDALKKKGIDSSVESANDGKRNTYRVNSTKKFVSRAEARGALEQIAPQEGVIVPAKQQTQVVSKPTETSQPAKPESKPVAATKASNVSSTPKAADKFEYGIQFNAFETAANAKEFQKKLLSEKGIKTIIHQFPDDNRKLYRVLTSRPFGSRDESDRFLKEKNVKGVILTFTK